MKRLTPEEFLFSKESPGHGCLPMDFNTFNSLMQSYHDHCEAAREIPKGFTEAMLLEQDKLPYTKHLDDGQYNDGQIMGFQLGAEWAYKIFCKEPAWGERRRGIATRNSIKMKIGDKVIVIGHTEHGGMQFGLNEVVEVVRVNASGNIKCSNGNEMWWLVPSEYRPLNAEHPDPTPIISRLVNAFSFDKSSGADGEDFEEQNSALKEAQAFLDKYPK
jgi:hypothetical protein